MDIDKLKNLIKKGESDCVEFKKTTGQRTAAGKTVCAFLNNRGGLVLFGVTDSGDILGQDIGNRTIADLSHELNKIDPPVTPDISTIQLENGKFIIIIEVKEDDAPYTFDGRPYERVGNVTRVMARETYERRLIERMHPTRRWENQPAPESITISDLDEEEIQILLANAIRIGRMEAPRYTDPESILRGLDLIEDKRLLNAAIVLFGQNVWSYYPQCEIRLARFRGKDRTGDFIDNRQYNGNAFNLLRRAERFLLDHVPIAGRVIPGKMIREDNPWYPPPATREALANAICHRDYTVPGGAVSLAMHNDRIEIANPGEFHFGITPEKLVIPHESKPWNPLIANAFYRAGIIDRWGSGTTNILEWCEENGNPAPQWQERAGSVVVTFLPIPESKTPEVGTKEGLSQDQVVAHEAQVTDQVTDQVSDQVSDQVRKILFLLDREEADTLWIMKQLKMSHRPTFRKNYLHPAIEARLIEMTIPDKPTSRLQKYRLTPEGEKVLMKMKEEKSG